MKQKKKKRDLRYPVQSKYIRSVIFTVIPVFLAVMIAVAAAVLLLFTNEVKNNALRERRTILTEIEESFSRRLEEISSISYHIYNNFYLEAVLDDPAEGEAMADALDKYLVGNDFIEHLAFYRLSEPDMLYIPRNTLSFREFWTAYLHVPPEVAEANIEAIARTREIVFTPFDLGSEEASYLAYTCPLPMLSTAPKAFVLMMIPLENVRELLEPALSEYKGKVAVYDGGGDLIYRLCSLSSADGIALYTAEDGQRFRIDGKSYTVQKTVSRLNGWTYVSLLSLSDAISASADKLLWLLLTLILVLLASVCAFLFLVIRKYKPIYQLAQTLRTRDGGDSSPQVINEGRILSHSFTELQEDSAQKQKFENAYHEAEAVSRAKSVFFSNMSHDIRTPMNAIIGMTEIARQHIDDPRRVAECLAGVTTASNFLLSIINNVLDMSRIEAGRLTLREEVCRLPTLVYDIETILNRLANEKKLTFTVTAAGIVHETFIGDSVRLKQIFVNILSNAVKFTPEGGRIALRVEELPAGETNDGRYRFTFSDSGIGMSREFQKKLFTAFERDENARIAQLEGTGLGMAITKSFVDLMGGSIACQSTLGEGTVFTVELALRLPEGDATAMPETAAVGASRRVLLCCRDADVLANWKELFEAQGATVKLVSDLRKAPGSAGYQLVLLSAETGGCPAPQELRQLAAEEAFRGAEWILAVRDPSSAEPETLSGGVIRRTVQTPLFRSTVAALLKGMAETPEKATAAPWGSVDLHGLSVLLVEDNQINRAIAGTLLREAGVTVTEAANGQEAVTLYRSHEAGSFHLILMDIQMPVMNGYEAAAAIRSSGKADSSTVPLYAMTANTFDEDVRRAAEAGMNGHLGKPYSAGELYALLADVQQQRNGHG